MLPEEYKRSLQEKLQSEARRYRAEKEAKLVEAHRRMLEELRREYDKAAERFTRALQG